ncbi:MAG: phosphodiesterase [Proteobacteria bacterium]|nr:phosphodiesterase [Pseudomonadota bacterium]MCP4917183.1 phosphodiesterase [Pseudomonadota bacterium]
MLAPGLSLTLDWFFAVLTFGGLLLVVARAALQRGFPYAVFSTVVLGLHAASSVLLFPKLGWFQPVAIGLQIVTIIHFLLLSRPRMRSVTYRALISVPASWFVAGAYLAFPWALLVALGFEPWLPWLGWAVAGTGVIRSLSTQVEDIDLVLDGRPVPELTRVDKGVRRTPKSLSIVQITDPHLGPFMSVERLRGICERAVARRPDLVMLTGDYLTMESNSTPGSLARALEPLGELEGRVFACMGNHDLEAPEEVASAMHANGIRLLIDESAVVETRVGPVQVIGANHVWTARQEHLTGLTEAHPRIDDALRILMLHDPGAFPAVPEGEADLVLSGHTHGGQLGLLGLGLDWTVLSHLPAMPDHGFWGLGRNRLYVHKGTGHYGFPLRIGVPAEESVLRIHRPDTAPSPAG